MEVINITFHYRHRKQIIIISLILLVLVPTIGYSYYLYNKDYKDNKSDITVITKKDDKTNDKKPIKEEKNDKDFIKNETNNIKEKESKILYKVDIKGEVNKPGIYSLEENKRIIDVINMAGGLTKNGNTSVINLSKKIQDEMVIIVYSNKEVEDFTKTKELEKIEQNLCEQKDENALHNDACINSNNKPNINNNKKISINNSSTEELMNLEGIGLEKAKKIIDYRNTNGGFKNIEELKKVPGIGESIYAKIKENITL